MKFKVEIKLIQTQKNITKATTNLNKVVATFAALENIIYANFKDKVL